MSHWNHSPSRFIQNAYLLKLAEKHTNIQVSQKIWISWKRSIFFSLISERETHILYRFITHRVKYVKLYFLIFLWLWLTDKENPKFSVSRKLEYYIRSIKKDIVNRNVRLLKSMFITMHSILGRGSFCMNYCINAAWHGDNQPVALLRCNGREAQVAFITAFRSSALLGLVSLIFLLTIPHRFSMGFRSGEFAGQSSKETPWPLNQLLAPLAVWAGDKPGWKMKSASP